MEPLTGRAPRDQNRVPVTYGVSTADGVTVLPIEVDPATGQLQTSSSGSGGGGTQYTDGATSPTHPIGTIPVFNNAGTITAVSAANPLPVNASVTISGVATAANQTNATQKTQIVDGSGNVIASTSNALNVNLQNTSVAITGSVTANAGTNLNTSTLALELGGNLASINAKIPALGQALGAASLPVVLASDIALPAGSNHIGSVGQFSTWNITNVSGTVSLPTGASTSAKQPALGTAGTASSDVLTVQGITSMTPLKVDGSGVTQPVSGTFWQTTQPVSLTSTTITGTVAVTESGTWNVGLSAGTNAIGSITNTSFAATQATAANLNATVVGTGTFAVQAAQSGTWTVGSSSATASAVPANAFYKGLLAKTANPSAASDGNLVGALSDKLGKQVVVGSIRDLKVQQTTTITASTSETTVLTAVASTFLDVYGVIIANSSLLATVITFKDSTAGTTRFTIAVPAGETRGFMLPESGAYTQATVNNNWTATSSVSLTSLFITLLAVKNI